MTKFLVKTDGFSWFTPTGVNNASERHRALKGDVIDLDEAALSASQLACLTDPGDEEALNDDGAWRSASPEMIAAMSVEQIVAYLNAAPADLHDSETERVVELEMEGKNRKGVLALLDDDDEDDGLTEL